MPFDKEVLSSMKLALNEKIDDEWETLQFGSIFSNKLKEVYERYVLDFYKYMLEEGQTK